MRACALVTGVVAASGGLADPPQRFAIVAGGGCVDPAKGQDYFARQNQFTGDALGAMGWETTRLFEMGTDDGADSFTEGRLRSSLRADRYPPGSELMVMINTHGTSVDGEYEICLGDGTLFRVSRLRDLFSALRERGVRVTVGASTCYSGAALRALQGTGACVVASTLDSVVSRGNDTPLGMVAQAAYSRLPAAERRALMERYRDVFPNASELRALEANRPDLDGDGAINMEELFLTSRAFGPFGHAHDPGQISSDVPRSGFELGRTFPLDFTLPNPASAAPPQGAESLVTDAFENTLYDGQGCPTTNNPLRGPDRVIEELAGRIVSPALTGDRDLLLSTARRLGFSSLSDVRTRMRRYVERRQDLYRRLRAASLEYNELLALESPNAAQRARRTALKQQLDRLFVEDAISKKDDIYMRLEKVYYLAGYLHQRRTTGDSPEAAACREFTL